MKPHYSGHRERLREKYLLKGITALSEYEILELLLFYSIPVKDTKPIAKNLLKKYGNIKEIFSNLDNLNVKGIGEKSLTFLKLISDIHKIIEEESLIEKRKIRCVEDVIKYSKNLLWNSNVEEFWVIFLNSKNEIIKSEKISEGIINEAYVYMRKLFEKAFNYQATALILIHNHPSGICCPSQEDIELTKKIVKLAREFSMVIHDHIIVSREGYCSFKEENLM